MLIIIIMIHSTLLAVPASSGGSRNSTIVNDDRDLDALTRGLASDFPLHSMSELRRTITDAEDDLWPHKDPVNILDRARERLRDGLLRW